MEENTPTPDAQEPLMPKKPAFTRTRTMGVKAKDKKTLFQMGADGKL